MTSFTRPLSFPASSLLALLSLAAACGTDSPPGGDDTPSNQAGHGGTTGIAGRGAGGATATGGSAGTGLSAGGSATGGAAGTGGAIGSGAASGAGGTGIGGAAGTSSGGSAGSGVSGAGGTAPQGGAAGLGAGGSAGAASGGTAGSGAGAAGASPGGAGGSGGNATGFFSEDFEAGTVGMQPAGWDNLIAYNKNGANPSGTTLALVDTMHVHGGTKAVHFHGDSNPAQLVRALSTGMTKLYVRAWVYMTRKLGQQTDMGANHETLIALRRVSGGVNDEVRFGEIKGAVGVNEVPSDNIAPTMDKWHQATGPVVAANDWACIEVAFLADATPNTLKSWLGGSTLYDVTGVGTDVWQNGAMPNDWLSKKFGGTPSEIVFGWQSFSSAANDVWMDDIVLSTSPIGCN